VSRITRRRTSHPPHACRVDLLRIKARRKRRAAGAGLTTYGRRPNPTPTGQTAYRILKRSSAATGPAHLRRLVWAGGLASSPWSLDCPVRPPRIKSACGVPAGSASRLLTRNALPWVCSYQGDGASVDGSRTRSSKKVARAINVASGNRPLVVLGNLSGFDGSPESMRSLQLE
jgi:hypothetical protein